MKQKRNSTDCVAAVAAMATGTSIEAFKKRIGEQKDGYYDDQLWKYLIGFLLVAGIPLKRTKYAKKVTNLTALKDAGIMQFPAVVTVASEVVKSGLHVLYWDGKKLHDPNPDVKNDRLLSDYDIYYWSPITKCE